MSLLGKLLDSLKNGEVIFEFRTDSGKLRRARGTLNKKRIPREDWPKGQILRWPSPKTDEMSVRQRLYQPFYDLDKGEWRRFKVLKLMRIVSTRPLTNILTKVKDFFS